MAISIFQYSLVHANKDKKQGTFRFIYSQLKNKLLFRKEEQHFYLRGKEKCKGVKQYL